jgi:hypothetical protein
MYKVLIPLFALDGRDVVFGVVPVLLVLVILKGRVLFEGVLRRRSILGYCLLIFGRSVMSLKGSVELFWRYWFLFSGVWRVVSGEERAYAAAVSSAVN